MSDELRQEIFEEFRDAGKAMTSYGYPVGEKARLFLESGIYLYATREGVDLSNIQIGDIEILRDEMLPVYDTEMHAMIYFQTPYLMKALKMGRGFAAPLDDMAQIIGYQFSVADCRFLEAFKNPDIAKFTKNSTALVVLTEYDGETDSFDGHYLANGRTLKEAVTAMEILEKCAEITFLADRIGFAKAVNPFDAKIEHFVYLKKYSKKRINGFTHGTLGNVSEQELKVRKDVVEYGKKLADTGLVQGTWGNISIKLDDQYMLVTPSGIDYYDLLPEDIVKVEISSLKWEGNLKPTSEKSLHAGIYLKRPDVKAIVHTHSKYCSVFAACEAPLPILEKDKDKYGDELLCSGYGLSGTKTLAKAVVNGLGDRIGTIMPHHGMVAVGNSIEDALSNAVFMENTAKTVLDLKLQDVLEGKNDEKE